MDLKNEINLIIEAGLENKQELETLRFYALGYIEGKRASERPCTIRKMLWKLRHELCPEKLFPEPLPCGTPVANMRQRWRQIDEHLTHLLEHKKKWAEWQMANERTVTFAREIPFHEVGQGKEFIMRSCGHVYARPAGEIRHGWEPFNWDVKVDEKHEFQLVDFIPKEERKNLFKEGEEV